MLTILIWLKLLDRRRKVEADGFEKLVLIKLKIRNFEIS